MGKCAFGIITASDSKGVKKEREQATGAPPQDHGVRTIMHEQIMCLAPPVDHVRDLLLSGNHSRKLDRVVVIQQGLGFCSVLGPENRRSLDAPMARL